MTNWDNRWVELAHTVANWSKDRSTKVGAVIVDEREVLVSLGWNGFPRGIDDNVEERHERPIKYKWTEHAERNSLYNAAANGSSTLNCRIYTTLFPCSDCCRGIIQSGIKKVISPKPDFDDERWGEDFKIALSMLREADIDVELYE